MMSAAMTMPAPTAATSRWALKMHGMERQKQRGSSCCFHPPETSAVAAAKEKAVVQGGGGGGGGGRRREREFVVTSEKLDQWISHAVGEIVKKTREAPVLIKVFSNDKDGSMHSLTLETEKASPSTWTQMKNKWDQENCTPDAIILIEELKPEEVYFGKDATAATKTWGLVIHGAGGGGTGGGSGGCVSCYVLNTSCVGSSFGFCTYYWLIRARSGEPLDVQLKKTWKV